MHFLFSVKGSMKETLNKLIELQEIEKIKNKNINELKILLANLCTEMLHGNKEAKLSYKNF